MNCSNCGKPLLAGSTICPVCGTNNTNQGVEISTTEQLNQNITVDPSSVQENVQNLEMQGTNTTENNNTPSIDLDKTQLLEPITEEQINANSQVSTENINQENVLNENETIQTDQGETQESLTTESETTNDVVELEDDEKVVITENMAPPTLAVEEENLTQGAGDLSNDSSVSTYSEEAEAEIKTEEQNEQIRQDERVDIAIPSVGAVTEVSMPSDGSAPEVKQNNETVGENTSFAPQQLESPDKKKKFKISLSKGSKNVPKTLMFIVSIIFLIVGILLGKALFSKNYCNTNTTANKSVISNKKVKYVSDGKNNKTNVGGYTYKIPEAYIYDKKEGGLLVYDSSDLFRIYIKVVDGLYDDLSGAKNSIRASMQENSMNVNNVKELKANDVEFLIFETTTQLNNRMIAFASASQDQIYYLEIVDANNGFDYEILDIVADILKNAEVEEVSTNMEKIDIKDISDVSVKAALEYKNLIKR